MQRFQGKFKDAGKWRNKNVPVEIAGDVSHHELAQQWFDGFIQQREAGIVAPEIVVVHTIRSLAQRWLMWKRAHVDDSAYNGCANMIESWVKPHRIYDVKLHELSIGDCTDWIEWVKAQGRAPLTNRNIVQSLRSFIDDAEGKGWVDFPKGNVLRHAYIKKALGKVQRLSGDVTIALKTEHAQRLIADADGVVQPMRRVRYVVAILSGLRASELSALTFDDIDLDSKVPVVRVFRQWKGNKQGVAVFGKPKWGSARVVPLHPTALQALRWWKAKGWSLHVGQAPSGQSPVFPNMKGEHSEFSLSTFTREDMGACGLPTRVEGFPIEFHSLRATFMSLLEEGGVSRPHIGNLAGHKSGSVADRFYIAKNINVFYDAIKKIPISEELPWAK